jgi:hypothetical protein
MNFQLSDLRGVYPETNKKRKRKEQTGLKENVMLGQIHYQSLCTHVLYNIYSDRGRNIVRLNNIASHVICKSVL